MWSLTLHVVGLAECQGRLGEGSDATGTFQCSLTETRTVYKYHAHPLYSMFSFIKEYIINR